MEVKLSDGAEPFPAQQLAHTEASPLSLSPAQMRQLAPAGPAQDPAPSPECSEPSQPTPPATHECPTPRDADAQPSSTAQATSLKQMHHHPPQTEGQVGSQICVRLAETVAPAPPSPGPAPGSEAPWQRMPDGSQQQSHTRPVTLAPGVTQSCGASTVQKQALQGQVRDEVSQAHVQQVPCPTAVPQTAPNTAHAKAAAEMHGVADAVLPTPIRGPSGSQAGEATGQHGSQARHAHAVPSRSSRNASRDRNIVGTRMSLRSSDPAPDTTRRKGSSSSRSGRARSALDVRAPAYATRYGSCRACYC